MAINTASHDTEKQLLKKKNNLIKIIPFWNDWKGTMQRNEKKNSLKQPHMFVSSLTVQYILFEKKRTVIVSFS